MVCGATEGNQKKERRETEGTKAAGPNDRSTTQRMVSNKIYSWTVASAGGGGDTLVSEVGDVKSRLDAAEPSLDVSSARLWKSM